MIYDLRFSISKNFFAENWKMVQPIIQFNKEPDETKTPNWK
jgi:hypothetical protein